MSKVETKETGAGLIRKDLSSYKEASNLSVNEHIQKLKREGHQIHHLAFGQSPFPAPDRLVEALKNNADKNHYLSPSGMESLRKSIAKFHQSFDTGIPASYLEYDNIVVADGSKILIYLIMAVTDAVVLLKSPSWTTYQPQTTLSTSVNTRIIDSCPDEQWKITPRAINQAIEKEGIDSQNKILIFANPCNPCGVVYSTEELEQLSHVLRKHKITVVCDEIYGHLTYNGKFTSLSKFLNDIDSCREFMMHTRRILEAVSMMCVRELGCVGISAIPAQAGYYIFPDFEILRDKLRKRQIHNGKQMCDAILSEAGVALLPGGLIHLRPEHELTVRLCFINFDGAKALAASIRVGLNAPLPDDFAYNYCQPTVDAIKKLVNWSKSVLDSIDDETC